MHTIPPPNPHFSHSLFPFLTLFSQIGDLGERCEYSKQAQLNWIIIPHRRKIVTFRVILNDAWNTSPPGICKSPSSPIPQNVGDCSPTPSVGRRHCVRVCVYVNRCLCVRVCVRIRVVSGKLWLSSLTALHCAAHHSHRRGLRMPSFPALFHSMNPLVSVTAPVYRVAQKQ